MSKHVCKFQIKFNGDKLIKFQIDKLVKWNDLYESKNIIVINLYYPT